MSNICKLCIHNGIPFDAQPCHSCLRLPNQPLFKLNNNEDNKCENCEAQMKQTPVEALVGADSEEEAEELFFNDDCEIIEIEISNIIEE